MLTKGFWKPLDQDSFNQLCKEIMQLLKSKHSNSTCPLLSIKPVTIIAVIVPRQTRVYDPPFIQTSQKWNIVLPNLSNYSHLENDAASKYGHNVHKSTQNIVNCNLEPTLSLSLSNSLLTFLPQRVIWGCTWKSSIFDIWNCKRAIFFHWAELPAYTLIKPPIPRSQALVQSFCLRLSPAGFDDASETLPFYFCRSSTIISSAPINFCLFLLHECRSPFLSLVQGSTNCSILPSRVGDHGEQGENIEHRKDGNHQLDDSHYKIRARRLWSLVSSRWENIKPFVEPCSS